MKEPQYFRHLSGKYSEIRTEYRSGRKDELARTVQKMAKQVNQRFYRLEKAGVGMSENAYKYAQQETGKEKPRYTESISKLNKMTRQDLYELALQLNKKIVNPTSTIGGVKALRDRRLTESVKSIENRFGIKMTPEQMKQFIDAGGDRFLNDSRKLSSGQVVMDYEEYVLQGKLSVNDFVEQLSNYFDKTSAKYSDLKKSFVSMSKKRSKRTKRK